MYLTLDQAAYAIPIAQASLFGFDQYSHLIASVEG